MRHTPLENYAETAIAGLVLCVAVPVLLALAIVLAPLWFIGWLTKPWRDA